MRPEARVWRKAARRALRGVPTGRRSTHRVTTETPLPRSSWWRRHVQSTSHVGADLLVHLALREASASAAVAA